MCGAFKDFYKSIISFGVCSRVTPTFKIGVCSQVNDRAVFFAPPPRALAAVAPAEAGSIGRTVSVVLENDVTHVKKYV
jgi:predicted NAD-dependent protein-ADP-ribosyltransferase YbiA (DUF1768 family)